MESDSDACCGLGEIVSRVREALDYVHSRAYTVGGMSDRERRELFDSIYDGGGLDIND